MILPLPPGIDPEAIGNAQLDDAYLASESSDAARRAREIERDELRRRVLDLRRSFASFRAIADTLNMSVSKVHRLHREALELLVPAETAAEARRADIDRIERLAFARWQAAIDGDDRATATIVALLDRRARLLGIDQPVGESRGDAGDVNSIEELDRRIHDLIHQVAGRQAAAEQGTWPVV